MSGHGLTVLAVDDERPQLEDLARMLRASPIVGEVECAFDGRDALLKASAQRYDAIFLDVRMPALDGVELARVLRKFAVPPRIVFVSAYDTAAVDAFELEAIDYLRKPVSRRRLDQALGRVSEAADGGDGRRSGEQPAHDGDVIAVGMPRGGTRLIRRDEILYAQAHGDYVRLVTRDGRFLLRATLAELERRWEQHGFVRVHRQHVANLRQAVEIQPELDGTAELVFDDGQCVPISRRHAAELRRRLGA